MLLMITILVAIIGVALILSILIQNPKGGGIDSTFGGQAQQMLGAAGSADFIEKATWYLAAAMAGTLHSGKSTDLIQDLLPSAQGSDLQKSEPFFVILKILY